MLQTKYNQFAPHRHTDLDDTDELEYYDEPNHNRLSPSVEHSSPSGGCGSSGETIQFSKAAVGMSNKYRTAALHSYDNLICDNQAIQA